MIQKRMRVSMALTLGMLFVMLAFGRGRLAPIYDRVGTAPPDLAEIIQTLFWPDHDGAAAEGGEEQGRLSHEIPRVAASSTTGAAAFEAVSPDNAADERSSTAALALPERETPTEEAPPAPPDPQAVRDSASAEVEALGPLHDELIEVLEAIQETKTDYWEKRWAGDRVTMARLAKSHDLRNLRVRLAPGGLDWSISGTRRSAAIIRSRIDRQIGEARETLAKLREPTPGTLDRR